jgi:hypothetical protein
MILLHFDYAALSVWLSCLCPFSVRIAASFVDNFVFLEQCSTLGNSLVILYFCI